MNKKLVFSLIFFMLILLSGGCGGGGGGGSTSVTTGAVTDTGAASLDLGLSALNSANPNYYSAKVQLNQVLANPQTSTGDKTTAYSALGWADFKSSSGSTDIDAALENFSGAVTTSQNGGVPASSLNQAYFGMAAALIVKSSENQDIAKISDAITNLNSAGLSNVSSVYADDRIKTNVTNEEARGYKAFLHYMRNDVNAGDPKEFADNLSKVSPNSSNRNAQLMYETLQSISQ